MTHPRGGAARGQAHHTTLQPLGQPEARNQLFKESPIHDPRSSNALHFVNVWTKEHLGGLQLNSLNKTTHMNESLEQNGRLTIKESALNTVHGQAV